MGKSQNGLVLSELEDDMGAKKWHFPKRNLTIAELCDFLLVIEATQTSGSLITAKAAINLGVEVGAIPGPIDSYASSGTNQLIQQGGHCISHPDDVISILKLNKKSRDLLT